ncbi:MAG: aspartate--tRNA ligase [Bacillota bacterium]|jgi:aspartyl-tRNA synthetase|nr:aspartate--tRNA ligase [Bacillota bacterium]NLU54222.1 aspartate--tRNA ligase [Bacillota bacterium]HOA90918.1 aspartate--tRNA ligase [Bacillota bacterium]HOP54547.1 aspartate--tRNA ligase [Bacillota bacterium]HPQ10168.1 aspartate--tRNA ligase [Bacillota bacterium]
MLKDAHCGLLRKTDAGKVVTLCGWVHRRRDHGGLIFVDLRDRSGLVQVVFDPETSRENFALAEKLRSEFCVRITGEVSIRPEGLENKEIATGDIEVKAQKLEILSQSQVLPFAVDTRVDVDENVRLKYRYLDLRREELQKNLILRHNITKAVRDFLDNDGFLEIETPMLTKSTPEGARDYLVPSRVNPGSFYALPQSPQIFKQLLMVSGFEKYFQIARCFRDEDLRKDRQPEFTQIDIEMSFIDEEDIYDLIERMFVYVFDKVLGIKLDAPFPRMPYAEAMERFGSDKPDTRFGMELVDLSDIARECGFKVFRDAVENGGQVKGLLVKGCADYTRKQLDDLTLLAQELGAKGLAYILYKEDEVKSPIVKFFSEEEIGRILERMNAEKGDLILFVADKKEVVAAVLGRLRLDLGEALGLIPHDKMNFLWIVDWPLLEWDSDEKRYVAVHHPFTSPKSPDFDKDPGNALAKAYDLVLNGVELGGGSIRIHDAEVQSRLFRTLGISDEEAEEKFGFLLKAFKFGPPPHGGIAFGLDRMIWLLAGADSIRDVIAFPKTQKATCLLTEAPSSVDPRQLRELHIASTVVKEKME